MARAPRSRFRGRWATGASSTSAANSGGWARRGCSCCRPRRGATAAWPTWKARPVGWGGSGSSGAFFRDRPLRW